VRQLVQLPQVVPLSRPPQCQTIVKLEESLENSWVGASSNTCYADLSLADTAVAKQLVDKIYEKRKAAALELEK